MHKTQTSILNEMYLTTIYIAEKWDQKENENENKNCPQDAEKPPQ